MKLCMRVLILMIAATANANATEVIVGHVKVLEATGMPAWIKLTMDAGSASCPAGVWLVWQNSNTDNNKAIYATLIAAVISGKNIRFHLNDGDTTCKGTYLHILDSE